MSSPPAAPMRRSTDALALADALLATPTGELREDLDEAERRVAEERERRRVRPDDGMTRRH
jgi:hypothetical protein